MRKSRFTEEQIRYAVQQVEAGISVAEVCRKYGISEASFYRWRQRFGSLSRGELSRLKDLERENARLKKLVAELTLDKQILQDVLGKKTEARASTGARLPPGGEPRDQRAGGVSGLGLASEHAPVSERGSGHDGAADTPEGVGAITATVRVPTPPHPALSGGLWGQPQAAPAAVSGRGPESADTAEEAQGGQLRARTAAGSESPG